MLKANRSVRYIIFLVFLICSHSHWIEAITSAEATGAVFVAHFDTSISAEAPSDLKLDNFGGRILADGIKGGCLNLNPKEYVKFDISRIIRSSEGAIAFWMRPHWDYNPSKSHAIFSWRWKGYKKGYAVLSDGWWENHGGGPYTYFVFNNQFHMWAKQPIAYEANKWKHFVLSWKAGKGAFIKIYIDGFLAAYKNFHFIDQSRPSGDIFIGNDKGSPAEDSRWADCDIDELFIFDYAISNQMVARLSRPRYIDYKSSTDQNKTGGPVLETRAIFDEGVSWMSPSGAFNTIKRISQAGFNVYVPCIWHGRGTRYPSALVSPEKKADFSAGDPLKRLISIAHEYNIEVHPWFTVALRQRNFLEEFHSPGTPKNAFDLHRPEFRRFMADLIIDVVKRYEIDGINLDYVRTMGFCYSKYCIQDYRTRYGRNLLTDLALSKTKGQLSKEIHDWQAKAVGDFVQKLSKEVREINPSLIISVDGHPTPEFIKLNRQGRREIEWAKSGLIDLIFNMDYTLNPDFENHQLVLGNLQKSSDLIMLLGNYEKKENGHVTPRSARDLSRLVQYVRKRWNSGVGIYLYSQLTDSQISALSNEIFSTKAIPTWSKSNSSDN